MPEGDTVHLAAQRLHAALAGAVLTRTDFRVPRLATIDLAGSRVAAVTAHGKHLFLRLDPGKILHSHLRMDGAWHLYRPGERWRGPAWQVRAILETAEWVAVGFRLPVLELLSLARAAVLRARLGPDPLGEDWDPAEVARRLAAAAGRTISDALLDQRIVAGIGNVYRCEICFLRGLYPWASVEAVPDLPGLARLIGRLFQANRGRADHVTTGDPRPGRHHWVYGRGNLPCRRCGDLIRKRDASPGPDGERVTYWCPTCQPAPVGG